MRNKSSLSCVLTALLGLGCTPSDEPLESVSEPVMDFDLCPATTVPSGYVSIEGDVAYKIYKSIDDVGVRPGRRLTVTVAGEKTSGDVTEAFEYSDVTDDNGCFSILVPRTDAPSLATYQVHPFSTVENYAPDGVNEDSCNGASWDFRQDDVSELGGTLTVPPTATRFSLRLRHTGIGQAEDALARWDILVTAMELVCSGEADVNFGDLTVKVFRSVTEPSQYDGRTSTISLNAFTFDEHDAFVLGHEFFHHVQRHIFPRQDVDTMMPRVSDHTARVDSLVDPRFAFGEGTASGFGAAVYSVLPHGEDGAAELPALAMTNSYLQGTRIERGSALVLFNLIQSEGYAGIHSVLMEDVREIPVFVTLQSFAHLYATRTSSTTLVAAMNAVDVPEAAYADLYDASNLVSDGDDLFTLYPWLTFDCESDPACKEELRTQGGMSVDPHTYNRITNAYTDSDELAVGAFRHRWFLVSKDVLDEQTLAIRDDDYNCTEGYSPEFNVQAFAVGVSSEANGIDSLEYNSSVCPEIRISDYDLLFSIGDFIIVQVGVIDPSVEVGCFSFVEDGCPDIEF